jgi:hypothetical protein
MKYLSSLGTLLGASFGVVLIFGALFISACTSPGEKTAENTKVDTPAIGNAPLSDTSYEKQIDHYSDGEAEYSGFYNNFEYRATILNSIVRSTLLQKQNEYYQWDREKYLTEKDKSDKEMSTETTVFLSFFTPDRKNDNLTDQKAIWRVYLEAGGKRYQGKAKRVRTLLAELQALYPYHTRWNTAYNIAFPVSTSLIETQPATLTITGPLGSRTVKFPPTSR